MLQNRVQRSLSTRKNFLQFRKNIVLLQGNIKKKVMPIIYEYFGFVFKFYSDEHYPIHVHVVKGECESIFDLIVVNAMLVELKIRKKRGVPLLNSKDAAKADEFIRTYYKKILEKWSDYFVKNIPIKPVKITKKL